MKREDLLKLGLTEEQANGVLELQKGAPVETDPVILAARKAAGLDIAPASSNEVDSIRASAGLPAAK
jgi:hypothetical protein